METILIVLFILLCISFLLYSGLIVHPLIFFLRIFFFGLSRLMFLLAVATETSLRNIGASYIKLAYPHVVQPSSLRNVCSAYDYCKDNRVPYKREEVYISDNEYKVRLRFKSKTDAMLVALQFGNTCTGETDDIDYSKK